MKRHIFFIIISALLFHFDISSQGVITRPQKPKQNSKQIVSSPRISNSPAPVKKTPKITPEEEARNLWLEGFELLKNDDTDNGIMKIRKSAEMGYPTAQYALGDMYDIGYILPKNEALAFMWHRKAAEQGIFDSQLRVGEMLLLGEGVLKNEYESFKWFEKAYNNEPDDAEVQYVMARAYIFGLGCNRNIDLGSRFLKKSADQAFPVAQYWLGELYLSGELSPKLLQNYTKAIQYTEKAAEAGIWNAMYNMGQIYENGYGVPTDLAIAKGWYQKAADEGHKEAQTKLLTLKNIPLKLTENGHEYIDLGLPSGTKWATVNVGSNEKYQYGGYYDAKEQINITKEWGGKWKIPSPDQFRELLKYCDWKKINNMGYEVKGPNGSNIFFPATGIKLSDQVSAETILGRYWTYDVGLRLGTVLKFDVSDNSKELELDQVSITTKLPIRLVFN